MTKFQFWFCWKQLINVYFSIYGSDSLKKESEWQTAYEALKKYPADKMKSAVEKIIETEQYFPPVAVIIKYIEK